jgi:cell division protein FtsQ
VSTRLNTDPRISRRRRAVARARRRRALAWAAGCGVVGAFIWLAFFSPLLRVRELELVGARRTSVAQAWAVSGLSRDDNLLRVDTGAVERALERLPWVRSVVVDRILPGTVRAEVSERRPVLVVRSGRSSWTLDRTGAVLAQGMAEPGLPVVEAAVPRLEPGGRAAQAEVRAALAVLAALTDRVRARVVVIEARSAEELVLRLDDGLEVRVGAAEQLPAKREVLDALLTRLRAEGLQPAYVDVSVPTRPAIGPPARP